MFRLGPTTHRRGSSCTRAIFGINLAPQLMQWLACWLVLELVCRADLPGKRTGQFSPRGATAGPAETHRGTRVWLDGQGIPGKAVGREGASFYQRQCTITELQVRSTNGSTQGLHIASSHCEAPTSHGKHNKSASHGLPYPIRKHPTPPGIYRQLAKGERTSGGNSKPDLAGPNGLLPTRNPPIEVGGFAPHLNEWVPTGKHPLKDPP